MSTSARTKSVAGLEVKASLTDRELHEREL